MQHNVFIGLEPSYGQHWLALSLFNVTLSPLCSPIGQLLHLGKVKQYLNYSPRMDFSGIAVHELNPN